MYFFSYLYQLTEQSRVVRVQVESVKEDSIYVRKKCFTPLFYRRVPSKHYSIMYASLYTYLTKARNVVIIVLDLVYIAVEQID